MKPRIRDGFQFVLLALTAIPAIAAPTEAPAVKGAAATGSAAVGTSSVAPVSGSPETPAQPPAPVERSIADLRAMRDPFKQPLLPPVMQEKKSELESAPLESYRMIGVLTGMGRMRAIVRGPAGKTYIVGVGKALGDKGGKITQILQDRILVNEVKLDVLGEKEVITKELLIKPDTQANPESSAALPRPGALGSFVTGSASQSLKQRLSSPPPGQVQGMNPGTQPAQQSAESYEDDEN